LQFLKNNYIEPVRLKTIFDLRKGKDDEEYMFEFLNSIMPDDKKYSEYNQKWNKLDIDNIKQVDEDDIEDIYKLSELYRISDQSSYSSYIRTGILKKIPILLKNNAVPSSSIAKLVYTAIKSELIPFDLISKEIPFSLKNSDDVLNSRFKMLSLRSKTLTHTLQYFESNDEYIKYELIWNTLFSMQFTKAYSLLTEWDPKLGFNKVRKVLLQSLFDNIEAEIIRKISVRDNFDNLQDYRFALDLLPIARGLITKSLDGSYRIDSDVRKNKEEIDRNNPNMVKLFDVIDVLVSKITGIKDIQQYGSQKQKITFGPNNTAFISSTKVIQIFIELGFLPKNRGIIVFDESKWLQVCENIYERYPYPALYFTLIYGRSKELVRKVAQNYIYNPRIYKHITRILCDLLNAILDEKCPDTIKEAIYIAAPIFMRAAKSEDWQKEFVDIYKKNDFGNKNERKNDISGKYNFLIEGVKYVNNIDFKQLFIKKSLEKGSDLDDIFTKIIIAASKDLKTLNIETCSLVMNLLNEAETPDQFKVLLKMEHLLDQHDLLNKLLLLPSEIYKDITLLRAACFFSKKSFRLQDKLKNIVIDSPLLWNTGIKNNEVIVYGKVALNIDDIQKGLKFSTAQLLIIYNKMIPALNDICVLVNKSHDNNLDNFFYDWRYVLTIMLNFIENNELVLEKESSYKQVKRKLEQVYNKNRGGSSIEEMLIDDERTGKAIESLVNEVYNHGAKKYQEAYSLIANRIIFKKSRLLNSCIIHFTWVMTAYTKDMNKDRFQPLLKNILKSYKPYYLKNKPCDWDLQYAEKDIVEREMIKLYKVFSQWGGNDRFWHNYEPLYHWQEN